MYLLCEFQIYMIYIHILSRDSSKLVPKSIGHIGWSILYIHPIKEKKNSNTISTWSNSSSTALVALVITTCLILPVFGHCIGIASFLDDEYWYLYLSSIHDNASLSWCEKAYTFKRICCKSLPWQAISNVQEPYLLYA